jgi:hypothetical protein
VNQEMHVTLPSALFFLCAFTASAADHPNIVLNSLEDISPMMGSHGNQYARSSVFGQLAAEGIRCTNGHSMGSCPAHLHL